MPSTLESPSLTDIMGTANKQAIKNIGVPSLYLKHKNTHAT